MAVNFDKDMELTKVQVKASNEQADLTIRISALIAVFVAGLAILSQYYSVLESSHYGFSILMFFLLCGAVGYNDWKIFKHHKFVLREIQQDFICIAKGEPITL